MKKVFITILGIAVLIVAGCQKEKEITVPLSMQIDAGKVEIIGSTAEVVKADTAQLILFRDSVTNEETDTVYNIHTSLRLLLDKTFEADKMEDTLQLEFINDTGASLVTLASADSILADSLVAFLNKKPNESIEIEFAGQIEKSKFLQLSNVVKVVLRNFSFHLDPEAGFKKILVPKFLKFVYVDDDIVIRKQPTINSLILACNIDGSKKWESLDNSNYNPIRTFQTVLPVIEDCGDWYKVYYSHGYYYTGNELDRGTIAFIPKNVCRDAKLDKPFNFNPSSKTRKYKDYFMVSESYGGDRGFILGKYISGMIVEFEPIREEPTYIMEENLTDAQIEKQFQNHTNKVAIITFKVEGSANERKIVVDKYNGPMKEL
ncbi:MAG: hypothetical protein J1E57_07575 [Prevotella sp.]|nr:hypothetical protein [Prevotella sp.]